MTNREIYEAALVKLDEPVEEGMNPDYDERAPQLPAKLHELAERIFTADEVTVSFTGQDETRVLRGAAKFRDSLSMLLKDPQYGAEEYTVLGPAPCPVPKINYNYRYRLTLRCRMTKQLRLLIAHLLREFSRDKANRGVSAFVDVNGYD